MQREACKGCGCCEDDFGRHGDFCSGNELGKWNIPNMSVFIDGRRRFLGRDVDTDN